MVVVGFQPWTGSWFSWNDIVSPYTLKIYLSRQRRSLLYLNFGVRFKYDIQQYVFKFSTPLHHTPPLPHLPPQYPPPPLHHWKSSYYFILYQDKLFFVIVLWYFCSIIWYYVYILIIKLICPTILFWNYFDRFYMIR